MVHEYETCSKDRDCSGSSRLLDSRSARRRLGENSKEKNATTLQKKKKAFFFENNTNEETNTAERGSTSKARHRDLLQSISSSGHHGSTGDDNSRANNIDFFRRLLAGLELPPSGSPKMANGLVVGHKNDDHNYGRTTSDITPVATSSITRFSQTLAGRTSPRHLDEQKNEISSGDFKLLAQVLQTSVLKLAEHLEIEKTRRRQLESDLRAVIKHLHRVEKRSHSSGADIKAPPPGNIYTNGQQRGFSYHTVGPSGNDNNHNASTANRSRGADRSESLMNTSSLLLHDCHDCHDDDRLYKQLDSEEPAGFGNSSSSSLEKKEQAEMDKRKHRDPYERTSSSDRNHELLGPKDHNTTPCAVTTQSQPTATSREQQHRGSSGSFFRAYDSENGPEREFSLLYARAEEAERAAEREKFENFFEKVAQLEQIMFDLKKSHEQAVETIRKKGKLLFTITTVFCTS